MEFAEPVNEMTVSSIVEGCRALMEMAWNGAGHFTCSEASRIYEMLIAVLGDEQADRFMLAHAAEDNDPDWDWHTVVDGKWVNRM
jgi:hypothetical protein